MSLAESREAFATALNTIDDITGYIDPPTTMYPGDAWPLLSGLEAAGPAGLFEATWRVLVVTGSTPADALAFLDEYLEDITEALAPVAYVQSVTPVTIQTSAGDLYGVELRTVRE